MSATALTKLSKYCIALALSLLLCINSAYALQISATSRKNTETISFPVPQGVKPTVFTLDNPARLVVDMAQIEGGLSASLPDSYEGNIRSVRIARNSPQTVRMVFELSGTVTEFSSKISDNAVSIRLTVASLEKAVASQPKSLSKTGKKSERAPTVKKPEKPVIVIDAGHGGQDPGAQGQNGTDEKDLTLKYAKALQSALLATKRYQVKLTRSDDVFILLRERIAIAHRAKGDLFISLHADSAPGQDARGLSIYSLSETASDKEAEMLAAKENRADILSGMDLSHESEDVANILISLAQRETNNTSAMLADIMVRHLRANGVKVLNNPHRFAGFAVLKSPDMPSVLVETGFISNPDEEEKLQTRKYRDALIRGLLSGIDSFFQKKQEGIL